MNDPTLAGNKGRRIDHWSWRHWRSVATVHRWSRSGTTFATAAWSSSSAAVAASVATGVAALRLAAALLARKDAVQEATVAARLAALLGATAARSGFAATARSSGAGRGNSFASRSSNFATAARSSGSATAVAASVTTSVALWLAATIEVEQRLAAALRLAARRSGFAATAWCNGGCTGRFDRSSTGRFSLGTALRGFAAAGLLAAATTNTEHLVKQFKAEALGTQA